MRRSGGGHRKSRRPWLRPERIPLRSRPRRTGRRSIYAARSTRWRKRRAGGRKDWASPVWGASPPTRRLLVREGMRWRRRIARPSIPKYPHGASRKKIIALPVKASSSSPVGCARAPQCLLSVYRDVRLSRRCRGDGPAAHRGAQPFRRPPADHRAVREEKSCAMCRTFPTIAWVPRHAGNRRMVCEFKTRRSLLPKTL